MTTYDKPFRWGILGTGGIAGMFADDLRLSEIGELVAVASRSAVRGEAFAARTSAPRFHASYAELLAADDIDACTSPSRTARITTWPWLPSSPARQSWSRSRS
jgi:predicted dehydrogenase